MEIIESINNPKVKQWYKLLNKKGRDKSGQYIIEGIKLIKEAIRFGQKIETIIVDHSKGLPEEFLELYSSDKKKFFTVSKPVFEKLSETETPQGIMAIIKKQELTAKKLLTENNNFILLLDKIQDPGNLGTIIRSADAAGVDAIVLGNGTVELYNPKVIRSAMGSVFHLPILSADLDEIIAGLKQKNVKIVGTSPYAKHDYFKIDFSEKIAILVGNESKGLSKERQEQVDQMVKIPIVGQAESLNVAMATSIVLFERVRQTILS
ncbi:hypothetical protein BHF71_01750 [Vulcanibacillus modesticaldus]|uniref:RNA 2-O ribose methyltransferase substrate binding domain-containing protein n=2 Tax=Vulcanibacillus modesticaldus TaxID=337097 RepID=A0A1D2YUW1_9BACI|nr:hypothetical protein BHF71_01750 [Vulcanibacillus modesticaldus]